MLTEPRRERELRRRRRRHGSSLRSQTVSTPRAAARGREEKDIAARSRPLAQPRGTEVEGDTADLPLRPPVVWEGGRPG
jgi:hypothetical protein